jgi:hypothetical protein
LALNQTSPTGEKAMPTPTIINAALMRPIVLGSPTGEQAGFEIVAKNGDQFLVPLSGEGMKGLIQDMQLFLEEHPHLAKIQSPPRQ